MCGIGQGNSVFRQCILEVEVGVRVRDPHKAWLDALREGDWLRLFLHAQWHTAQVSGRSSAHVLLATRRGEPLHTVSRVALLRLRTTGLATTIEQSAPVRQAVDTLMLDLDAAS